MILFLRAGEGSAFRLGVVTGRKIGDAHFRTKARRRLREVFRRNRSKLTGDYDVLLEPANLRVGTVNEDFAIESMAGDIFQLGNTSYRILRIEASTLRVADAHGQPPSIPFWFGEAPGRTNELSAAVARLREEVAGSSSLSQREREQSVSTPYPPLPPNNSPTTSAPVPPHSARCRVSTLLCWSGSSTKPATCTWWCTRVTAAA